MFLWTILVALLLAAPAFAQTPNSKTGEPTLVGTTNMDSKPRVIDGDTVRYQGRSHRLLGLDTPEVYSPQCPEEAAKGYQAAGRLQHLINARSVRLEETGRLDKYGRPLSRLFISGEDVAAIMVRESLARPYTGGRRQPWCPSGTAREGLY